ncbi:hypothetical protein NQ317_014529 [Molorchus minor]|uniref:Uncharacterized protein n=1 Tax=Molorchus minor TaxID=1323400 RepID=A0ABQ9JC70_9CUCU|nr:hypothetical protein NQ317_014529 [Molorchus minor]
MRILHVMSVQSSRLGFRETVIRNKSYKNGIHRYPVSQEIGRYTAYQLLHFFHRNGDDFKDLNVAYLIFEMRTYRTGRSIAPRYLRFYMTQ